MISIFSADSLLRPSTLLTRTIFSIVLLATLPAPALASHHNDSAASKADPRLNVTDMFVFPSKDGQSTVFVMGIGKDAGREGPKALHPDGLYDFNIDSDGDLIADIRLRFRFDAPGVDGTQGWSIDRLDGLQSKTQGSPLAKARGFNETVKLPQGGRAWVGISGDLFVANAASYFKLVASAVAGKADFSVFDKPSNFFSEMDVISLVVEIPNASLRKPDLAVWATTSVERGAEAVQVNRWGNVLTAFLFANNDADADSMNRSQPKDDVALHRSRAAGRIAMFVKAAGTSADPQAYGDAVAARLIPLVQRYKVGTPAIYGFGFSNGRALSDDGFDVMMSTMFNRPVSDGVSPGKLREEFPYVPLSRRVELWISGR